MNRTIKISTDNLQIDTRDLFQKRNGTVRLKNRKLSYQQQLRKLLKLQYFFLSEAVFSLKTTLLFYILRRGRMLQGFALSCDKLSFIYQTQLISTIILVLLFLAKRKQLDRDSFILTLNSMLSIQSIPQNKVFYYSKLLCCSPDFQVFFTFSLFFISSMCLRTSQQLLALLQEECFNPATSSASEIYVITFSLLLTDFFFFAWDTFTRLYLRVYFISFNSLKSLRQTFLVFVWCSYLFSWAEAALENLDSERTFWYLGEIYPTFLRGLIQEERRFILALSMALKVSTLQLLGPKSLSRLAIQSMQNY